MDFRKVYLMKAMTLICFLGSTTTALAGGHFGDDPFDYIPELLGTYDCSVSVGGENDEWASITEMVKYARPDEGYSSYTLMALVAQRGASCPNEVNDALYRDAYQGRAIRLECNSTVSSMRDLEGAMDDYCRGEGDGLECDESQMLQAIGDPLSCRLLDYTYVFQNLTQRQSK